MSMPSEFARLPTGSHRKPCPYCQKGRGDKALSVKVDSDGAVWNCFRCGWSGRLKRGASHTPVHALSPIAQVTQIHTTLSPYWRDLWESCSPIAGEARAYLEARHCVVPPVDGDLRWHPKLRHPSKYVGPALVGLITDALTKEPISLHRTWVRPDGKKASVNPSRLLSKGHRKAGGVIRLWPDEAVAFGLAVAEGIETSLCAAHGFAPIWSVIDAGNMEVFPTLAGINALTIFADNDAAGMRGASACAERWSTVAEVTVVRSETPGADIADEVAA